MILDQIKIIFSKTILDQIKIIFCPKSPLFGHKDYNVEEKWFVFKLFNWLMQLNLLN
jgi:hypothetical protein